MRSQDTQVTGNILLAYNSYTISIRSAATFDDAPRLASRISAQNCLHKQSTVRKTWVKWPCLQLSRALEAGDEGWVA